MVFFYCPKCNKEECGFDYLQHRNETTWSNIRDGYGRPIRHFRCECGNLLAGTMELGGWEDHLDKAKMYAKDVIAGYNEGGICYVPEMLEIAISIDQTRRDQNWKML